MQQLLSPGGDEFIQAVIEMPTALSGLTDDVVAQVLERVTEDRFGDQLAKLDDLQEAIDLTNVVLGIGLQHLRREVQFDPNQPKQFDEWMASASIGLSPDTGGDSSEATSETFELAAIQAKVAAGIDEIFARAFPALYPDHPVNKAA
jgi:hypothetical protein